MDTNDAIAAFAALAQPTRLAVFRMLVGCAPDGVAAGELARRQGIPQNTMSAHLASLARAGLVTSERASRLVIYRADLDRVGALLVFLLADCCGGRPEICTPLVTNLSPCCPPRSTAHV